MKILVVCAFGGGSGYSGPVRFLNRLFEPLSSANQITVLHGKRHKDDKGFAWAFEAIPLMTFTRYSPMEQARWAVMSAAWIAAKGSRYDIVHVHGAAIFSLLSALGCRRRPFSVIALSGNGDLAATSTVARFRLARRLRRHILGRASICWALSEEIAGEYADHGVPDRAILHIGNPVSFRELRSAARDDQTRLSRRTVGFVGVVGERKGADLVLGALALLRANWPEAAALFVGPFESVEYRQKFQTTVRLLGLEGNVRCTGYVDEVSSYMGAEMTVFVLPSSKEGLPGALTEALASGLPAVVTDVGAMGTTVRQANAGMVSRPDRREIASCVGVLWQDLATWQEYSSNGMSYAAANFDARSIARYFESETSRVVSAGQVGGGQDEH